MAGAQLCNQQSLSTCHTKCCTRKLERKRLMPSDGGSPSHHMLRNGAVECGPIAGACNLARRRSCAQSCSRTSTRAASTAGRNRGRCSQRRRRSTWLCSYTTSSSTENVDCQGSLRGSATRRRTTFETPDNEGPVLSTIFSTPRCFSRVASFSFVFSPFFPFFFFFFFFSFFDFCEFFCFFFYWFRFLTTDTDFQSSRIIFEC